MASFITKGAKGNNGDRTDKPEIRENSGCAVHHPTSGRRTPMQNPDREDSTLRTGRKFEFRSGTCGHSDGPCCGTLFAASGQEDLEIPHQPRRVGVQTLFSKQDFFGKIIPVSTVTAILEAQPDGTVHLPVPPMLRNQTIKIKAHLEAVGQKNRAKAGLWRSVPGPFFIAPDFDGPLPDFGEYME